MVAESSTLLESLEDKLQSLKSLSVRKCGFGGRHLIDNVGKMQCLQTLVYEGFPAAQMPRSFPQSLWKLELYPHDWPLDLPEGLKELYYLKSFEFDTAYVSWEIKRTLAELLPVDSLEELQLGSQKYDCKGAKMWQFETPGWLNC